MLQWTLTLLMIALFAGALAMWVVAGTVAAIAKILFVVFVVFFLVSVIERKRSLK